MAPRMHSGDTHPCKVTLVILHGVVSRYNTPCRLTGMTLHGVVSSDAPRARSSAQHSATFQKTQALLPRPKVDEKQQWLQERTKGLVLKAYRLVYYSTLGWRVKNKKNENAPRAGSSARDQIREAFQLTERVKNCTGMDTAPGRISTRGGSDQSTVRGAHRGRGAARSTHQALVAWVLEPLNTGF